MLLRGNTVIGLLGDDGVFLLLSIKNDGEITVFTFSEMTRFYCRFIFWNDGVLKHLGKVVQVQNDGILLLNEWNLFFELTVFLRLSFGNSVLRMTV